MVLSVAEARVPSTVRLPWSVTLAPLSTSRLPPAATVKPAAAATSSWPPADTSQVPVLVVTVLAGPASKVLSPYS